MYMKVNIRFLGFLATALVAGTASLFAQSNGKQVPATPPGRVWVKIAEFVVPPTEKGAKTQPGQDSRFSDNCSEKWPNPGRDSTVVYIAPDLTANEIGELGKFTVMEDKPNRPDQSRMPVPLRMGEVGTVGGIYSQEFARHYLARLTGKLPGRQFVVFCYELR
jgi:hypothetical protein